LDRHCRAAFKARAHGTMAARWSVAQCMAQGGDGAPTRGPDAGRRPTSGTPRAEKSELKTLLKRK
jgi:hypothetical protein